MMNWSHVAIATIVNFRWTGYNTLIFLAAMQAIPPEMACCRASSARCACVVSTSRK